MTLSDSEKIICIIGLIVFLSFINTIILYFGTKISEENNKIISDPIEGYINKITKRYEMHMVNENEEESDEKKENEIETHIANENNYMFENTPLGYIIMNYNNEKQGFEYYSNRSLPYRLLEALSKKFVMVFGCKELYKIMKSETKKTEMQKKIQHKAYAKLKPMQKEKIEKTMNMYYYKGKINEFIFLQYPKLDNVKKDNRIEFSYSDFKKKNAKNKK